MPITNKTSSPGRRLTEGGPISLSCSRFPPTGVSERASCHYWPLDFIQHLLTWAGRGATFDVSPTIKKGGIPVKRHVLVAVLSLFAITACRKEDSSQTTSEKPAAVPAVSTESLSARPAAGDGVGQARFAWYLFIQAMSPANGPNGPLAFENWTEQCSLNPNMIGCPPPATGNVRTLHISPLLAANRDATAPGIECSPMNTTGFSGYPAPSNVTANAQFCEEVFVNNPESTFVRTNGLTTLTGQQTYGNANGGAITFPWDAVEIKADWVPVSSYSNPTFQCPDPTGKLYTETINGTCYALVGVHISSKVLPNWLWATFEPDSSVTNPNRCDPNLYDTCFDPWGTTSSTPYAKGQPVPPQSAQLKQAMTAAGLNAAFNNYYLTGVQTEFVSNGQPVPLGNSFVEFNAGVPPGQASCITCHRYAYFDGKQPPAGQPEDNFGGPPTGWSAVGYACNQPNATDNCTPVVPNSTSQDFSWMLGLMPYK
jgi:hypothetical protein